MAGGSTDNLVLLGTLADELAAAAGALLGTTGTAAEVGEPSAAEWTVRVTAAGTRRGAVTLGFGAADAATLARLAMGFDEDPEDAVVADMLREVCNQACGALTQAPAGKGSQFTVDVPVRDAPARPSAPAQTFRVRLGDTLTTILTAWDELAAVSEGRANAPAAAVAPPVAQPAAPASQPHAYPNLDVILDIDLPLSVRFGETEMTVDALTKLGPGSVIDLGRSPDDPVDVLVNGRMVAKGEVVVVGGSYGVRITEVVSAADRLRTMAA